MNGPIHHCLRQIECAHKVIVLFACESGSRAWGFESRDSDYDVRFVYAHHRDWYLSLQEKRDTIEQTYHVPVPVAGVLDMAGWDVRKALRLFRKGNPPLLEWINSPCVYEELGPFAEMVREVQDEFFSPAASVYHYRGMARRNFKEYLKRDRVRVKKYLYVIRPLLAMIWLQQRPSRVPVSFSTLFHATRANVPSEVQVEIQQLVDRKRAGDELEDGPCIHVLNDWIESELLDLGWALPQGRVDPEKLDRIFREVIK